MIWRCMLALLISFQAQGEATLPCELELSPNAEAMIKIIKALNGRTPLSVKNLKDFAAGKLQGNPLNGVPTRPLTGELKTRFGELYAAASADDLRQTRSALSEYLMELERTAGGVADARRDTEDILSPKIIKRMEFPGSYSYLSHLAIGTFEGRPVAAGEFDASDARYILFFDPFHPEERQQVRKLGTHSSYNGRGRPNFFSKNGRTYLITHGDPMLFDVGLGTQIPLEELGLEKMRELDVSAAQVVDSKYLVTTLDRLIAFDLLDPKARPRVLSRSANGPSLLTALKFGEEIYAAGMKTGDRNVYQLMHWSRKPTKSFTGYSPAREHSLLFELNGRPTYAFRHHTGPSKNTGQLVLYDILSDKPRPIAKVNQIGKGLNYAVINKVPYIYFPTDRNFTFVNLQTEQEEIREEVSDAPADYFGLFDWRDESYMVWRQGDQVRVSNFATGHSLASDSLGFDAMALYPVEFEGKPYAIVMGASGLPRIMRLTTGAPRGAR